MGIVRKRQSRSCAVGSGFTPDPTVDPTPDPIDGQPAGSGFTPDPTVDPTPDPIDGQPQGLPRQNKQLTNNNSQLYLYMNLSRNTTIAATIVVAVSILSYSYLHRFQYSESNNITVKGLGAVDFKSDLIVWEGSFKAESNTLNDAYAQLSADRAVVKEFLKNKGIVEKEIIFGAVSTSERTKNIYNSEGNVIGEDFIGYRLRQSVRIGSGDLEKVELVSRSITEVLNNGVKFYSESPSYFYTKLQDLKLDLVSKATEDAKTRANIIAKMGGASIGDLKTAQMGVFQIVGKNSNEEYSWGGSFNTTSKYKTASITMDLTYELKN